MSETISSLAFLDDRIVWIQGSLIPDQIVIERFVETELPFQLTRENITRPTSAIQLANQISYLAKANNLDTQSVRLSIPGRMGLTKRIWIDDTIPQSQWKEFARSQVAAELISDLDDYVVYLDDEKQSANGHGELLAVLFRKDLRDFFKKIAAESQIQVRSLMLNVFGVEELFRQNYGNLLGTSLLINVMADGIESTLINETQFLQSVFYPYGSGDTLEDRFLKAFEMCNADILKRNELSAAAGGDVTGIFIYGYHLQPKWLNNVQEIVKVPIQIFNFSENTNLQINAGNTDFPVESSYQYLDAIGNFFI